MLDNFSTMDTSSDNDEIVKKCFKCDEPVFSNLNIVYNESNSLIVLWNKFQILLYENLDFKSVAKVLIPEFPIQAIIASNNHLLCLDFNGNVHTASLKFKNPSQRAYKLSFQPRENNIIACSLFDEEHALCLQQETEECYLNIYKISTEFKMKKKSISTCDTPIIVPTKKSKCFVKVIPLSARNLEIVKTFFSQDDFDAIHTYSLVLMTFDRLSVYCGLLSANTPDQEVIVRKLYTCPCKITDIDVISIDDLDIVIGLSIGTFLTLNVKDLSKPKTIHMNTAIHKFFAINETVIYTDGITMWKADNMLSREITFSKFFVKNVKDFSKFGDQIICTTFSDMIYTFSLDDATCYKTQPSVEEYCSVELATAQIDYITAISNEAKKSEEWIKMHKKERNYILALALTNRPDIMNNVISQQITVYEDYESVLAEHTDVILTSNFSEYFDVDSYYFLLKITTVRDHRLAIVLSNCFQDSQLHITMISEGQIVKTISIKLSDVLKKISLLIPLKMKFINISDMKVQVRIVTSVPGVLDAKQKIWTTLYKKVVTLNSEHFIKYNFNANKNISLKELKKSLPELILQVAKNQYSHLIEFTDIKTQRKDWIEWKMHVKLPLNYQEVFQEFIEMQSVSQKITYFLKRFPSKDMYKSKNSLCLSVGNEVVKVGIDNDGFSPATIRVSSQNMKIALDVRNFLSDIIYDYFLDFEPGTQFITHNYYATVENMQKAIREVTTSTSEQDIFRLIERFERRVIGFIPL